MKVARFTNGESVLYDRLEEHGDKVLFFRAPIGLVHAKQKLEIVSYDDNSSSPKNG